MRATDPALVRQLIDHAGTGDEAILKLAGRVQYEPVVNALCEEVFLDLLPADRPALRVRYEIRVAQHVLGFHVDVTAGAVKTESLPYSPDGTWEADGEIDLCVRQGLPEFAATLHAVFGPAAAGDGHRVVAGVLAAAHRQAGHGGDADWHGRLERRAAERRDLGLLALRCGTDKWGAHWYARHYAEYFQRLRAEPVRILEIGVGGFHDERGGGESLEMWRRYFPRGLVYGIDIADKSALESQRVRTFTGHQSDTAFLESVVAETGELDIVVDDGSHFSADQINSFRALVPHVRPGGLYAIEDLHTSYWPGFGGNRSDFGDPGTAVGFLKDLVDGLNHEDLLPDGPREPARTDTAIVGVHFFHSLAILEMGDNREGAMSAFIPEEIKLEGPQLMIPDYPLPPE
ncbi:hypothetical protein [Spirillospora sp. NPDC047279]|uniref:hypothetical protein n=1 Tax=Spirillospora sp. NPDC047279 TaxID=3155478 RepID=UPI0033F2C9BF